MNNEGFNLSMVSKISDSEKIVLVGPSASGKDYYVDKLVNVGFKKSVDFTTRPMRDGEIDGVTYNYISVEDFKSKIDSNDIINYEVFLEDWFYGNSFDSWEECRIFIKTVGRVNQMSREERESSLIVYLDIPEEVRRERLLSRSDSNDDVERRINSDREDFDGFENFDLRITDPKFNPLQLLHIAF